MSQINKRLEALEQRKQVATGQPKQIIGTRLETTTGAPHTTTSGNIVSFHHRTLKEAFALREAWLAEQKDTIALVSPTDTGDRVLEVLAEKHA